MIYISFRYVLRLADVLHIGSSTKQVPGKADIPVPGPDGVERARDKLGVPPSEACPPATAATGQIWKIQSQCHQGRHNDLLQTHITQHTRFMSQLLYKIYDISNKLFQVHGLQLACLLYHNTW